jgi:hypothetical protein
VAWINWQRINASVSLSVCRRLEEARWLEMKKYCYVRDARFALLARVSDLQTIRPICVWAILAEEKFSKVFADVNVGTKAWILVGFRIKEGIKIQKSKKGLSSPSAYFHVGDRALPRVLSTHEV